MTDKADFKPESRSLIYPDDRALLPEPWQSFMNTCNACSQCELHRTRKQAVVCRGSLRAPLMLIGEGPGAEEDARGLPFVGASGRLLDLLLTAYGIAPQSFHICNIVKCRPPGNRAPAPEEAKSCKPLLASQFRMVQPRVIVLLGATAFKYFTGGQESITRVRGSWIEKNGYHIMPTFHPAYILRNNTQRVHLWQDIGRVRSRLEELSLIEPLPDLPAMPPGRS